MIEIKPLNHFDAVVAIPGSKSYTHRALIASALAEGESVLFNALRSEDTEYTAQGLEKLGIKIAWEGDSILVQGKGGVLKAGGEKIYVGDSGTSMRFLTALAALKNGRTLLDGSERMRKRPMAELLGGLVSLGVKAYSLERNGYPPVVVDSQGLEGGNARIKGSESSQFLSALLMVAPLARADVRLEVTGRLVSRPYVDITRGVMADFGVEVQKEEGDSFFVRAGQRYSPRQYRVEGDASNASYFLAAAAITSGKVRVENFRPASLQGDAQFLAILEQMGCEVSRGENWAEVRVKELRGIEVDMNTMPDLVPTLAIVAAFAQGKTVIRNVGHLRHKESDRLKTVAGELAKMGVEVAEGKDWLQVERGKARGAEIETHNDHRLAMSFAIAGLAVPGIKIKGERCVAKSFPGFWETLKKLY
ncbi:MAG: 3-phosphoshikimate 1-carboxyvinyltransferase [Deltaproteobacteria bacterium RBG_13_51_10]|nr:MAG: 3-phosphoshikimate 1-carboxyvinyltransferase [Deltaproteobacteria bacterium RBG_13_51_10]